jgi:alpha-L-arabinofuranosidase
VKEARDTQIVMRGAKIKAATATVLTNSDIHAHNTFADKDVVMPRTQNVDLTNDALHFRFPAASVTKLAVQLM